jgi:hypothetical protein
MAKKKVEGITLENGKVVKVNFGVEIPETKQSYTKAELEAAPEVLAYLLEIGSGAVSEVEPQTDAE